MREANSTAETYLRFARDAINEAFGAGYAEAHPTLVATFMQTAAADFHTAMTKACAQDIRDALLNLSESLGRLARDEF